MKQMKRMRTLRSGTAAAPQAAEMATAAPRRKSAAVFRQDWDSYGRIVANNYLYHREAYGVLADVLRGENRPFRFLDIACGDASASAGALAGTNVSAYHGIDLSEPGLERAAATLAAALRSTSRVTEGLEEG